jgi:hypothetical protein
MAKQKCCYRLIKWGCIDWLGKSAFGYSATVWPSALIAHGVGSYISVWPSALIAHGVASYISVWFCVNRPRCGRLHLIIVKSVLATNGYITFKSCTQSFQALVKSRPILKFKDVNGEGLCSELYVYY